MIALSLGEIAELTGGALLDADPATLVTSVESDSRKVVSGGLFAALPGARADGTKFLATALAQGAAAALVPAGHSDRASWAGSARIEVADVQAALGPIAHAVRIRAGARIIGITGSSGKTTTKDMLEAVLSPHRRTIVNERSFNNELGVPLTLCRLEPDTEIAVIEMGTAGAGQIAELCEIAEPDVAVVTVVGMAHYEQFGSQDAIAAEKSTLPAAVSADGLIVLNADDPRVLAMRDTSAAECLTFGLAASALIRAERVRLDADARASFVLITPTGTAEVQLPVPGEHMVVNALAAAATAIGLGLNPDQVAQGLSSFRGSAGRMQTHQRPDGVTVIDDSYNANPVSVRAAVRTLAATRRPGGRTVLVLGTMADLGEIARSAHEEIGRLAAEQDIDLLVTVGEHPRFALAAAQTAGLGQTLAVDRPDQVAGVLEPLLRPDDVVLLKGSRSAGLDESVGTLLRDPAEILQSQGQA